MITGLSKLHNSKQRDTPLWEGPESDGDQGGVTQSLISRFLSCRERFRLYAIEGLKTTDTFIPRIEYGNMWHSCEESHARNEVWSEALLKSARKLSEKYPNQQEQVDHWYNVCKVAFPTYVDYWSKHKDVVARTPLMQEKVFHVPYTLPSGRTVYLRGKFDAVDLIGKGKGAGIWLFETKTKSEIDVQQLTRQLTFDLQSMCYLVSLEALIKRHHKWGVEGDEVVRNLLSHQISGVRYNVIRRPLSGGAGTIVRKKATEGSTCTACEGKGSRMLYPNTKRAMFEKKCSRCHGQGKTGGKPEEPKEEYYARVGQYLKDDPSSYFARFNVVITPDDITKFQRECLDPILEQMCDWYSWMKLCQEYGHDDVFTTPSQDNCGDQSIHYRHPFGVVNYLDEGYASDVDNYLATGSMIGLQQVDTLFRELSE